MRSEEELKEWKALSVGTGIEPQRNPTGFGLAISNFPTHWSSRDPSIDFSIDFWFDFDFPLFKSLFLFRPKPKPFFFSFDLVRFFSNFHLWRCGPWLSATSVREILLNDLLRNWRSVSNPYISFLFYNYLLLQKLDNDKNILTQK